MMNDSSIFRQEAIEKLINSDSFSDQKQIVESLLSRYGIETNQATVSRDLRKLGVVKKEVKDRLIYELPTLDARTEILRLALIDIQHNESMIVINTYPGLAAFVGDCVDQHSDLEILGCLAGENVVFVIPKSIKTIRKVCETLCQKFHFKK